MQDETGNVIIGGNFGESGSDSDFVTVSSLTGGTVESENVIFGEPERAGTDRGTTGGPRLTKRGTVDGRSTRRNRSAGPDFGTQNATNGVTEQREKPGKPLSLENVLMNIHLLLSEIADMPELKLEKDEARDYGAALFDVQKEYGVAFSSKTSALVNLAGVMGKIYVPMGIQVRNRLKNGVQKPSSTVSDRPVQKTKGPIEMKPNGAPPIPTGVPNMSPSDLFGPQDAGLGPSA